MKGKGRVSELDALLDPSPSKLIAGKSRASSFSARILLFLTPPHSSLSLFRVPEKDVVIGQETEEGQQENSYSTLRMVSVSLLGLALLIS